MSTLAYCIVAQSPMRSEPSDRSEMVSQILFGEACTVLNEQDNWLQIACQHDGYRGWVDRKHLVDCNRNNDLVPLTAPAIWIDDLSGIHRLSPGAMTDANNKEFVIQHRQFKWHSSASDPSDVLVFAEQYLGTPYLWGGRSIYGIDCSGYTQQIARFNGLSLPRDAYQQVEFGEHITFLEESRTGDFAFFDNAEGRIIHVGMIVRENETIQILHASGMVRCDLLDHQGIFRVTDQVYSHNLRAIKRIL